MKKSLLVAALIAGFAGAAQAETSVTLYGRVDGGIGYQQFKGTNPTTGESFKGSNTGMANGVMGGNRWGLKGAEDLGEGLQAVFVLENGFNLSDGTQSDGMFGRQATLGLKSSSWGQLDFGRQTTVASKYLAGVASPFGPDWGQASVGSAFSALNSVRYNNMIMYQTPKFSGFQLGLNYSFTGNAGTQGFKTSGGDEPNDKAWGAAARYANGPLAVALSYDEYKTSEVRVDGIGGDRDTAIKSWNLAGSFDFDVVEVHAAVGQTRNGWFKHVSAIDYRDIGGTEDMTGRQTWGAINDAKVNSYTLGLSAPVGASGKILASWVMADPKDGFGDDRQDKQHFYSLGYTYKLSKRTNVYALGSYGTGVHFYDDLKATQFAIGLRHQF
ncbi:porin [Pusillimonas caeni]|uniref:porin n=1 Tax=Pusillimonas caeni TaxID=1348472 RepID=UPI000E59C704|nr:porin [Pusillimonas caeni]TFL13838.1 porin [Pusillimonas caeni]